MCFNTQIKMLVAIALALVLATCGGSGTSATASGAAATPTPTAPPEPTFSLVGPQDTDPVTFACGNSDGDKTHARYPMLPSDNAIKLAALPDGGLMGRIRAGTTNPVDTYFWIDRTGRRTAYTARALDDVRVDMEGQLWWIGADKTLWRGALQPNGQDERIGSTANFGSVPADGPSTQLALGQVRGFAATNSAAFLLVADDAGAQYFLRRMTRNADASWQSRAIVVPTNVAKSGDSVTILANRSGQLALVVRRPGTDFFISSGIAYRDDYSYWQWQPDNTWLEVAKQRSWHSSYSADTYVGLRLDTATLGDDGNIIWGGGENATLYKMGQDGSWSVIARPGNISATAVGQDGDLQKATFLSAYGVAAAANGGLVFYDGETCQVRKLVNQSLTTVSGPSYTIRPHFDSAKLEIGSGNALIAVHERGNVNDRSIHTVPRPTKASYDLTNNRLTALDSVGSLEATSYDFCSAGRTNASRFCTNYNLWPGLRGSFAGIDSVNQGLYSQDSTKLYRLDTAGPVAVANVPSTTCSGSGGGTYQSQSTFVSGQSDFPYILVADSGCPPPGSTSWTYVYSPTLYRFDVTGGKLQPVFPGKQLPLKDGEANFVQKRTDSGFWVAGTSVVNRLTSNGDLMLVAGNKTRPPQAKDGKGSAAGFANIKRSRNLADNSLLVLDADAVRLVDDAGNVRTLFTLASSGIAGDSIVDLIPNGHDVYLTLANQPMLMRAKNVLP